MLHPSTFVLLSAMPKPPARRPRPHGGTVSKRRIIDGHAIYTDVPPYFTIAQVFELNSAHMWHGLPWGCAI